MRTTWRINAGIGQNQPFDRLSAQNVGFDDFIHVGDRNSAIPDRIRINHDIRPVLALVQTAGFIGPYPVFQPALGKFLFEDPLQLAGPTWITAGSGTTFWPLVDADENVLLELGHEHNLTDRAAVCIIEAGTTGSTQHSATQWHGAGNG
jgi:hypothetical protein